MREELKFKLYCSVCETVLELDMGEGNRPVNGERSMVGANSAYELNIGIRVRPCTKCKGEQEEIKNLFSSLVSKCSE